MGNGDNGGTTLIFPHYRIGLLSILHSRTGLSSESKSKVTSADPTSPLFIRPQTPMIESGQAGRALLWAGGPSF